MIKGRNKIGEGVRGMRMGFVFSEAFWGIFLILMGIAVVLKAFFGLNIPLFRTAFAILLICMGISMLAGGNRWIGQPQNTIIFNDAEFKAAQHNNQECNIIFGSGMLDLTQFKPNGGMKKIKLTTVFGSGTVRLDPNLPVVIKVDSAFANASFPDGTSINFGNHTYQSPSYKPGEPYLEVKADVVFSSLSIFNEAGPPPVPQTAQ